MQCVDNGRWELRNLPKLLLLSCKDFLYLLNCIVDNYGVYPKERIHNYEKFIGI